MSKKLCFNALRMLIPGKTLVFGLGLMCLSYRSGAVPVTVQDVGMGPNKVVQMTSSTLGTAWVYAGPVNLLVNGIATEGFCIDPFHWSISGPQQYNTEALGAGPKSPGGAMGAATALKIEQLWTQYFSSDMSSETGAGLQIAIWELVGGVNFHLDSSLDYGAGSMLGWVNNNPLAPGADLLAVTGPGQDFVIPGLPGGRTPSVPDGGSTVLMLGFGLAGILALRKSSARA